MSANTEHRVADGDYEESIFIERGLGSIAFVYIEDDVPTYIGTLCSSSL